MKNLVLINNGTLPLPSVLGGAVENLIQLLIDLNEEKHYFNFIVYSIFNKEAEEKSKKYQYTTFRYIDEIESSRARFFFIRILNSFTFRFGGKYFGKPYLCKLVDKIQQDRKVFNYDLLLLEGCSSFADYIKRRVQIPIIQRVHNTPLRNLKQWDIHNALSTDLYLGISNYISNELKSNEGSFCSNIETLYNSINFPLFTKRISLLERNELRQKYKLKESDLVFIYTGRIQPYKGVKELIKAFLNIKNENVKLLIVGASTFSSTNITPYIQSINDLLEKKKNDNVIFTGYIDYECIYKYYQIADIAIFPSLWEEPFALTCLEALVSKLPVIITNSGGMVEMVNDSCGVVIDKDSNLENSLTNAMMFFIYNQNLIEKMGEASYEISLKFHSTNYIERFKYIIDKYF